MLTQLLDALKEDGVSDCHLVRERDGDLSTLQGADIVALFRCSELQTTTLARAARLSGAVVMYATDDNLLEVPKDTRDGKYFQNTVVRRILTRLIRLADAVLVYSPLAQNYFARINPNTILLETLPAIGFDRALKANKRSNEIVVGYAGTASHATDFEPVVPAIRKLLDEIPNVRFDFVGYCPPELIGTERVSQTTWIAPYENYLAELIKRSWDIGLAPLKDTLFNNCKTNLKFREYAACGIAGIYSDTQLYRAYVRDQQNGLLVSNTEQGWYEGIRKLADHPQLRDEIRAAAELEARTKYTIEKSSEELRRILQELSNEKSGQREIRIRITGGLLYAFIRPIGIALAMSIQSFASIRHGTFWRDMREEVGRRRSNS